MGGRILEYELAWPMAAVFSMQRHELETQYNFNLKEGHNSCIGGSFRWDYINSSTDTAQQIRIDDRPLNEYNVGMFAIDRWELTDQWELETQLRGDYYTPTGFDWSGRLTGFYKPEKDSKDVLRFSAAKAFSAPLSELRESSISTLPMGPIYLLNATPPRSLENERIYSLEAGYTTMLSKTLSLRIDAFYQKFDKIIAFNRTTNYLGQMFVSSYNFDGAEGWGSELEMSLDKT